MSTNFLSSTPDDCNTNEQYVSYEFIAHPYMSVGLVRPHWIPSVNTTISHEIHTRDLSRDDLLELFQHFLMATGYHFAEGEGIGIVEVDV